MAKAGSTNLVDVIRYADLVTKSGFVFMDTPGYDPIAATGQVAGGANRVCFTTGRGSVFGCLRTAKSDMRRMTGQTTSRTPRVSFGLDYPEERGGEPRVGLQRDLASTWMAALASNSPATRSLFGTGKHAVET
jgi:hypothetical protein